MQKLILTENFLVVFYPFLSFDFSKLIFTANPEANLHPSLDSFFFSFVDFRNLTLNQQEIQRETEPKENPNLNYFNLPCFYKKDQKIYYYERVLDVEFELSTTHYEFLIAESVTNYLNRFYSLREPFKIDSIQRLLRSCLDFKL